MLDCGMTQTQTPAPSFIDFSCKPDDPAAPLRRLQVRTPSHEQLAVWQMNAERFTEMGAGWARREQALAGLAEDHPDRAEFAASRNREASVAIQRTLKIVKSILVQDADRMWIEDQVMDGELNLEGAFRVVTQAVEKMRTDRGTTPAAVGKKATRAK
jgi:hypothetical protein